MTFLRLKKKVFYPVIALIFALSAFSIDASIANANSLTPVQNEDEVGTQSVTGSMRLLMSWTHDTNVNVYPFPSSNYNHVYKTFSYNPSYTRTQSSKQVSTLLQLAMGRIITNHTYTYKFH